MTGDMLESNRHIPNHSCPPGPPHGIFAATMNRFTASALLIAVMLLVSASALRAQSSSGVAPVPTESAAAAAPAPGPSLDLASQAARAALEACKAKGFAVGVSVIDSAGVLKVLLAQ